MFIGGGLFLSPFLYGCKSSHVLFGPRPFGLHGEAEPFLVAVGLRRAQQIYGVTRDGGDNATHISFCLAGVEISVWLVPGIRRLFRHRRREVTNHYRWSRLPVEWRASRWLPGVASATIWRGYTRPGHIASSITLKFSVGANELRSSDFESTLIAQYSFGLKYDPSDNVISRRRAQPLRWCS